MATALQQYLELCGLVPLKTWKQCEADMNCMETGGINHVKHNGGKTLKGYRNEHNPDGSLTTIYEYSDGSLERVQHTMWAGMLTNDPDTKTQTVVQPAVVEKIAVAVQLNPESEGDRIMRITREMAGG